jgi:D-3-phosphoglycerate dehydrogenase
MPQVDLTTCKTKSHPKIYILDPYHPEAVAHLQSFDNFIIILPDNPRKSELYIDADAVLLQSKTYLGQSEFNKAQKLRVVAKQGIGIDIIDLEAAAEA